MPLGLVYLWLLYLVSQAQPETKWCLQMASSEPAAVITAVAAAIARMHQAVALVTAWHWLWMTLDLSSILNSSELILTQCWEGMTWAVSVYGCSFLFSKRLHPVVFNLMYNTSECLIKTKLLLIFLILLPLFMWVMLGSDLKLIRTVPQVFRLILQRFKKSV